MGSVLGCFASEAACCFGSAACRCAGKACGGVTSGIRSSTATRVSYALLFLFSSISAWIMLSDWAIKNLEGMTKGYLVIQCPTGSCYGTLAVYRITFAIFLFHSLLGALLYNVQSSSDPRAGIQNGFWGLKLLTWLGLLVGAFFIPNEFFIGWSKYFAMWAAGGFVLVQVVLLIDFAYNFSENLLAKWEETDDKKYIILLAAITLSFFVASVTLTVILYLWFGPNSCPLNQFFITMNLIVCFLMSVLSILPAIQEANPTSGLAQSAITSLYATYLTLSAVSSEPLEIGREECTPLLHSKSTAQTTMIVGALFTFIALAYSTSRAATQGKMMNGGEEETEGLLESGRTSHAQAAFEAGALTSSALEGTEDSFTSGKYASDDEKEGTLYSYTFFHVIFAMAACYVAMLLTNWNTLQESSSLEGHNWAVGRDYAAVWVKIVSSWLVLVLYGWTLVAPVILPDRF